MKTTAVRIVPRAAHVINDSEPDSPLIVRVAVLYTASEPVKLVISKVSVPCPPQSR